MLEFRSRHSPCGEGVSDDHFARLRADHDGQVIPDDGAIISAMGLRSTSPTLVARRDEVDRLMWAADVAIAREPAVVLIAGEAGVGKSRLVDELAARAARRGMRVAIGRCIEFGETASSHVSAVLRKLGVSNRVEAAAIAHRHSLDLTDVPAD